MAAGAVLWSHFELSKTIKLSFSEKKITYYQRRRNSCFSNRPKCKENVFCLGCNCTVPILAVTLLLHSNLMPQDQVLKGVLGEGGSHT